ncbi:hypothetical protein ACYSNR_00805 [Enterococcus sp. LJL128]
MSNYGESDPNYFFNHVYQDRRMLKWQGMFLSEHTSELGKDRENEKDIPRLPQQSQETIAYYLERSIKYNKVLSIQLNTLDENGKTKHHIVGVFRGFPDPETILINEEYIEYADIRHIQMKHFQKWSETDEQSFQEIDLTESEQKEIDDFCNDYIDADFYDESEETYND